MRLVFGILVFGMGSLAHAASYISCGKGELLDGAQFEEQVLEFSSESDNFNGNVGGTWSLKYAGQEWEESGDVTAETTEKDGISIVEILVTAEETSTGPLGTRYLLIDPQSENPTLQEFTRGGFAGTVKVAEYKCVSGND